MFLSVIQPGQTERHDTLDAAWDRIKDSTVRAIVIDLDASKIVREVETLSLEARRALYDSLYREERAKLVPTNGIVSGQQIAYAKGRASKRFAQIEKVVTQREP